jgi:hypothetical protein
MTDKEKINAEKQELNLLINNGMTFTIERTVYRRPAGFCSFLKRRVPEKESIQFKIEEPTLSTLDRLAAEQIDLVIDETIMQSDAGITEAKKLTHDHAGRMARILAIAVLGQDYLKPIQIGSRVKYEYDDKRLDELTELLKNNIKPSKLVQLTLMVNTMSNLGDFINSIRLMSATRTTMPTLIEVKEKV